MYIIKQAMTQETLSSRFLRNKGKTWPAHPRSLINAFVIRLSISITSKHATSGISIF